MMVDEISKLVSKVDAIETSISKINSFFEKQNMTQRTLNVRLQNIENLLEKTAGQSGMDLADRGFGLLNAVKNQFGNDLYEQKNAILDVRNWVEKVSFESTNAFIHLNGLIEASRDVVKDAVLEKTTGQTNETLRQVLALRAKICSMGDINGKIMPRKPAKTLDFAEVLERAKKDYPNIFDLWHVRLSTMARAFEETVAGNAANWGDPYSVAFRDFVHIHGAGQVLDIGCGVFGSAIYLDSFPAEQISGIDPLPMTQKIDFEFVQGISEYLPWPDKSFNTVISATSLDHALSLSKSLDEMDRVMMDNGVALLWIGSIPGSAVFTPDAPDFTPSDKFHLFHFDQEWFEPMLNERFNMIDRVEFWLPQHSHIFYALHKK